MQSAKRLGAIAVGLPTGVSSIGQLMDAGADYLVTSMVDLPLLVERLEKTDAKGEP
jgi:phosphoglycolate phosphatase-like HAD superfamily hydrolase